ncbi:P1 family peptidase [Lapillicoccus jejuensis]|uniref:Putative pantetheine hydrolase n=1 Tax=Lapillicoccus jejuensis TaxID=402171 RepID=A0A542E0R7_9MICO|nr:P1 family peptidase [Lapillicoccus jejuensis]TQJ08927.1 putative pantetheine hydrolase [Lapillicoccus jejuensis]
MTDLRPGPHNALTDVAGLRVGHATRREPGWLTGTTVVVAPDGGAVCGVDVRGGGPGTRETDLLDPRNLVDRVDAVVLGGGSALGLAAADGVAQGLLADGRGWPMGAPGAVVPIVPGAILFDLGRGGVWGHHPRAEDGRAAYDAATGGPVPQGVVGAGTGASAGGLKGGIGTASVVLPTGVTVAALVAVNAVGSAVDPATGEPYGARHALGDELAGLRRPLAADVEAARARAATLGPQGQRPAMATTIGVIATDATLTKAQAQKTCGLGHDGMARAISPVHTLFDGDTLFCLATGERPAPDLPGLFALMAAAGDCVTRAIVHALLAAESVDASADGGVVLRSYRDAFPSAF